MSIKIGLDLGMSSTKLVGPKGEVMFFNQASIPNRAYGDGFTGLKSKKRPMVISSQYGDFYVGKGAHDFGQPVESFDFEHLTGTNEMRALVYGALSTYQKLFGTFEEETLVIAVGLPLMLMTGENAKRNQAAVIKWLSGVHIWQADREQFTAEVEKVLLAPQALGALYDYVFDMGGQAIAGHEKAMTLECAEISVGSNSVELMVTKRNSDTEKYIGGKAVGVRKLFKRIDPRGLYSYGELDLKLRGKDDEFDEETKQRLPNMIMSWSVEVNDFINKQWEGAHERFHKIFVVGGGVYLLEKELRHRFNGRTVIPENPVMSIGRGLYKILLVNVK